MNETRPSDTISNDLVVMRHAHEAIAIASKSGEYNGEMVSLKEQKKLPQVDYRIERAIGIGEFLDKVVGNAPYRAYGVLAASYHLLCCNLNQRVNEIDEDKKPSEYASPKQLIPPKDIDIKSVERCKNTLEKWLANNEIGRYVKPFKKDIDRLNKLIDYRDNEFKKQKDYPGDKLVFNPFRDSVLYYANQLFYDCWDAILVAASAESTGERGEKMRKLIESDVKPAGKIQTKTCGMDKNLRGFEKTYGFITALLETKTINNKKLNEKQLARIAEICSYSHRIIEISKGLVVSFDYLNYYSGHFDERHYARFWLKCGLLIAYDKITKNFYQTLDDRISEEWVGCRKPKTPDIAHGDVVSARKNISDWLNDEKAMGYLRDFEYDMEQSLRLEKVKQVLVEGQNEEYRKIVKPICDSFNEFTNITHFNCQEILRENKYLK